MSEILHTWGAWAQKSYKAANDIILERSRNRQKFYELCVKLLGLARIRDLKLIMENPWGCHSYLQKCFVTPPALIDKDRSIRGDIFRKPTAYWYINCEPTKGYSFQPKKPIRVKKDARPSKKKGLCSEERSMISPDYARNFICDFIIGKEQQHTLRSLFD